MRKRYSSRVERAGDVLGRWLRRNKRDRDIRQYAIRHRWRELVGEQLAARTEPGSLRGGLLTVVVASAAWLNELAMLRGSIVRKINELFGHGTVTAIRLVAGRVSPAPDPPPAQEHQAYVELSPEEVERVEREVEAQVDDPELREAIFQARLSQLRRSLRFDDKG
jgi:hypothetical protein